VQEIGIQMAIKILNKPLQNKIETLPIGRAKFQQTVIEITQKTEKIWSIVMKWGWTVR
jgi:hypothetical protein